MSQNEFGEVYAEKDMIFRNVKTLATFRTLVRFLEIADF
jgi:hypothetical protein